MDLYFNHVTRKIFQSGKTAANMDNILINQFKFQCDNSRYPQFFIKNAKKAEKKKSNSKVNSSFQKQLLEEIHLTDTGKGVKITKEDLEQFERIEHIKKSLVHPSQFFLDRSDQVAVISAKKQKRQRRFKPKSSKLHIFP